MFYKIFIEMLWTDLLFICLPYDKYKVCKNSYYDFSEVATEGVL